MTLRLSPLLLALLLLAAGPVQAEGVQVNEVTIPVTIPVQGQNQQYRLRALVMRPDDGLPHPLALISHGSPRDAVARAKMKPDEFWASAMVFARRGFTTAVVMRRGFGESQGQFVEGIECQAPNYALAGVTAAEDLSAAITVLDAQPYVDRSKLLLVGLSVGGLATIALTAYPPPGLTAAIAFAPGDGSFTPDTVCAEDRLVATMGQFGRRSRVPLLWVSAANDHYFGPAITARMVQAFKAGGGNVSLVQTAPFGEDGHLLFSDAGQTTWTPIVDQFLAAHELALRAQPIENVHPDLTPPPGLSPAALGFFHNYLAAGPHKAFAVTAKGITGWWSDLDTPDEARTRALANCQEYTQEAGACRVVYVDDAPGN